MANASSAITSEDVIIFSQYNEVRADAIGPFNAERVWNDNQKAIFGTTNRAEVYHDGTDFIIDPDAVGAGILDIQGAAQVEGFEVTTNAGIQLAVGVANPAYSRGLVFYDSDEETLAVYNNEAAVTIQLGQEIVVRATNKTGVQIDDGAVVYIDGVQGNRPTIALARSDSGSTATVIGVATHDIADNATGFVTVFGLVHSFDTTGFSAGDILWLDPATAGAVTNVMPVAPNFPIQIGTSLNSTENGRILVNTGPTDVTGTMVIEDLDINSDLRVGGNITGTFTGTFNGTITESQISDLGTAIALVADKLSVFAATTSAELRGIISNETGSGLLVFASSPTLVTPAVDVISESTPEAGVTIDSVLLKDGLVDGIDVAARDHAVYTDAEAITAVESEATLDLAGDVTVANAKSLAVDTIIEKTAETGVTIDSVLLKDGLVDGIDVAARDHAKYLNSEAIAAVEGEATLVLSGVLTATSPVLTTPDLGTPSALVGTNISGTASGMTAGNVTTNADLTGEVVSTGNAASLGSFTKSALDAAISDGDVIFVGDAPTAHKTSHENGGGDEIGVGGLSGLLADDQHIIDAEAVSAIEAGATVIGGVTPAAGTFTNLLGDNIAVGATEKINLDGLGGDTYIYEESPDKLDIVVGGVTMIEIDQDFGTIGLLGSAADANQAIRLSHAFGEADANVHGINLDIGVIETTGATGNLARGYFNKLDIESGNSQNWTDTVALRLYDGEIRTISGSTGVITGIANFYATAALELGATITNQYGLYIPAATVADNNYGVFMAGAQKNVFSSGLSSFGGAVDVGDHLTLTDGGTVAQGSGSGKATTVTINTHSGQITMDDAQLNVNAHVSFQVTNSHATPLDVVIAQHASGGTENAYEVSSTHTDAGHFFITVENISGGNLAEAIVINFIIIGGASS